jgi:phage gp36-like protein
MAYSTDSDLLKEMTQSELAKLTGDTSGVSVDSNRTAYARENADAMINAYLSGRFNVPFSGTIDPIIRKLSIDLTVSNLYDYAYGRTTVPSTLVWRKLNAVKLLKDIQSGYLSLISLTDQTQLPPPIISNKDGSDKFFRADQLDSFADNS